MPRLVLSNSPAMLSAAKRSAGAVARSSHAVPAAASIAEVMVTAVSLQCHMELTNHYCCVLQVSRGGGGALRGDTVTVLAGLLSYSVYGSIALVRHRLFQRCLCHILWGLGPEVSQGTTAHFVQALISRRRPFLMSSTSHWGWCQATAGSTSPPPRLQV